MDFAVFGYDPWDSLLFKAPFRVDTILLDLVRRLHYSVAEMFPIGMHKLVLTLVVCVCNFVYCCIRVNVLI